MEAKPIVLIKVQESICKGGRRLTADECMEIFENRFPDYHVLAFPADIQDVFQVQTFYQKDFTEIQYEELKKIIIDSINNIPPEKK